MPANNTNGAIHLTTLDLDISKLQAQVQTVNSDINNMAKQALENAEKMKQAFQGFGGASGDGTGSAPGEGIKQGLNAAENAALSLEKRIASILNTLYKSPVKSGAISGLATDAEKAKEEIDKFASSLKTHEKITKEDAMQISKLNTEMKSLETKIQQQVSAYNGITRGANASYESINKSTTAAANFVKTLSNLSQSVKSQSGFSELEAQANNILSGFKELKKTTESGIVSEKESEKAKQYATQLENLKQKLIEFQISADKTKTGRGIGQIDIQNLIKQYTTLQSQLSKFKNTTTELEDMKAKTSSAITELNTLSNTFKTGNYSAEEMAKTIAQLKLRLAELQTQKITLNVPTIDLSQFQKLTQDFASFNAKIAGKSGFDELAQQAIKAENELKALTQEIQNNGKVTSENIPAYNTYANLLQELSLKYTDITAKQREQEAQQRALNAQYKDMEASIKPAIATLKELEKIGRGSTKTGAAELRKEYENLASSLRNISVADAQRQLDGLNSRLSTLTSTAQTGTSAIHRFVDAFTGRARFMAISTIITTITNSIRGVKDAIIETEDAAIELIRVLDNPPDMSVISEELYDIAYEYGQSFENVQDVAVKFAQTGMEWSEVLDAVQATMLGLNTAELEVSTATNGLIAVMSQFNIEAESLEEVIDKINITADNFPVTSEKIVAALQRTGASAAAAGMTLEQTIGIITALSEATGRSGENIGTALNSIINFTTNAKALDKFEKFLNLSSGTLQGQNPLAVWTALGQAIKDDGEALGQMMAQSEEFSKLFSSDIADAIGLTGQLNEAIAHQEDVYNAAGTYRKTYFIALLNNIATATDAIKNMENAIGYSEEENVTAMEALSKKIEQMGAAARELAVHFGEGQFGFLNFMKVVVETTTSVLKFTDDIGGLNTVLLALVAVFATVKAQKISDTFNNAKNAVSAFFAGIKSGQITLATLGASFKSFITSAGGIATAFTAAYAAINFAISKYKEYKAELAETRQAQIDAGKSAAETSEEILSLYEAYTKASEAYSKGAETAENLKTASDNLSDALGTEKKSVDELTTAYEEMNEAQKEALKTKLSDLFLEQLEGLEGAQGQFLEKMESGDFWDNVFGYPYESFIRYYEDANGKLQTMLVNAQNLSVETASEYQHEMEEIYNELLLDGTESSIETAKAIREQIKVLEDATAAYEDAAPKAYKYALALEDLGVDVKNFGYSLESVPKWVKNTSNEINQMATAATSAQGPIVNLTGSFATMEEYMESLDKSIDDLTKRVDGFQSAYETVTGIIEEYNKTGYMTADMMQTLMGLDPEYIQLLDIKSGKLQLNQEKLNELSTATDNYMQELLILQTVKQIDSMLTEAQAASDAGLTVEEYRLKVASQDVQSTTYQLVKQFYSGQISADAFKSGIARVAEQSGVATGYLNDLTTAALNATSALGSLGGQWIASRDSYTSQDFEAAGFTPGDPAFYKWLEENRTANYGGGGGGGKGTYFKGTSAGGGGGGGKTAEEQFEETIKNQQEALDDLLSTYEHGIKMIQYQSPVMDESATEEIVAIYKKMQDAVHEQAESFRAQGLSEDSEYIQKLKENWWEYQNAINEAYQEQYNTMADVYDHEIELLSRNSPAGNAEQIVAAYKIMQEKAHELAEYYRSQGLAENSEYIQKLQKDWWDYEDEIKKVYQQQYDDMMAVYDHGITMSEYHAKYLNDSAEDSMKSSGELVAYYKLKQEEAHRAAEALRAEGVDENDEMIQQLQEDWWEYEEKIVAVYQDMADKIIDENQRIIDSLDNQIGHAQMLDNADWELNLLQKQHQEHLKNMQKYQNLAAQLREADAVKFQETIQKYSDAWWDEFNADVEVTSRMAELLLEPFDEFISMADSMDLWEYMDFSKLDYLQEKLKKINELYEDGTLSAQKYNELLKEINVELYNAQVEELERRKKELEDEYDKLIEAREKEIDKLKDEKDAIQDRADAVVDGYKAEIEVWKKRKEETEDYYDKLIDELQDVQKANDRINKQIDYYNARQKIITNLEQARARSGVEWREKEMEYQQQLIDLDEDWNRTQQDWNIEDQIDRLEELKNLAIADIDATIDKINAAIDQTEDEAEAAIKAIDDQIDSIEDTIKGLEEASKDAVEAVGEEIKKLSKIIAEAIQKGLEDGLADTNDEFIQAGKDTNAALLAEINKGVNTGIGSNLQNIESIINKATGGMYSSMKDSFFTPVANGMSNLAGGIKNLLGNAFDNAATDGYTSFKNKLINPLTNDISAAMGQATKSVDNKNKNIVSKYRTDGGGSYGFAQKQKDSTILVQNYVTNTSEAVKKTSSIIQNLKV